MKELSLFVFLGAGLASTTLSAQVYPVVREGSAGVIQGAKLPNPGTSSKGGVQSVDCTGTGHVQKINTDGTVTCSADTVSTAIATRTAVFNVAAPASGDDGIYTVLNPATAVHLTRISCGVTGTTSVVVNLEKGGASLISDMTATAGTVNQVVVTTWANGSSQCGGTSSCAVAAHTPVTLHIGTISGTPTNLACSIDYSVD